MGRDREGQSPSRENFLAYVFSKLRNSLAISFYLDFFYFSATINCMGYKLSLSPEDREFFRLSGRKGGRKCNPRKGFGSGDNARKAALARWAKVKKAK